MALDLRFRFAPLSGVESLISGKTSGFLRSSAFDSGQGGRVQMTEQIIPMRRLKGKTAMPLSSIIALSVIVAAFLLFAVVLAWADHHTRSLAPDRDRNKAEQNKKADAPKASAAERAVRGRDAVYH